MYCTVAGASPFPSEHHWTDLARHTESGAVSDLETPEEHPQRDHQGCQRILFIQRLKAGGEGDTEDEMVGWHHQLNGHEFVWIPGVGDGQGSLACCSPWGCKESDTEQLN